LYNNKIMKKIIIISVFLLMPLFTFAQWDDCPFGETDDSCSAPGKCGRYTDSNSDQICDHSQDAPIQEIKITKDTVISSVQDVTKNNESQIETQTRNQYPLFMIVIVTSLLYSMTYILAQNKTITVVMHKKIWNSVLTVAFLATSILGIMLIMRINSGNTSTPPFNIMYWHVVTGIVMMTVTAFHIGWHWRYYKNLFKK
jgi:hypothetical protein